MNSDKYLSLEAFQCFARNNYSDWSYTLFLNPNSEYYTLSQVNNVLISFMFNTSTPVTSIKKLIYLKDLYYAGENKRVANKQHVFILKQLATKLTVPNNYNVKVQNIRNKSRFKQTNVSKRDSIFTFYNVERTNINGILSSFNITTTDHHDVGYVHCTKTLFSLAMYLRIEGGTGLRYFNVELLTAVIKKEDLQNYVTAILNDRFGKALSYVQVLADEKILDAKIHFSNAFHVSVINETFKQALIANMPIIFTSDINSQLYVERLPPISSKLKVDELLNDPVNLVEHTLIASLNLYINKNHLYDQRRI